jgi:hypothetical protein
MGREDAFMTFSLHTHLQLSRRPLQEGDVGHIKGAFEVFYFFTRSKRCFGRQLGAVGGGGWSGSLREGEDRLVSFTHV